MRYWTPHDLIRSTAVPLSAVSAVARVVSCLPAQDADGFPRIIEVATRESEDDVVDLRLLIELAHGLTLSREYSEWDVEQTLEVGGDHFAGTVLHDVERALPNVASLLELVRSRRPRIRRLVARAQRRGDPVRLIRLSVLELGAVASTDDVTLEVEIEALGENLRPRRIALAVPPGRESEETLAPALADHRRLVRARAEMGLRGADGTIDALALAAIRANGQFTEALLGLARAERFWLKDGTALVWKNGHVSSASNDRTDGLHWLGEHVTIEGHDLPETTCAAAAGRPVTELVHAPLFDRAMTIRAARREDEDHVLGIALSLDLPRMYLDLEALEVWPVPDGQRPVQDAAEG